MGNGFKQLIGGLPAFDLFYRVLRVSLKTAERVISRPLSEGIFALPQQKSARPSRMRSDTKMSYPNKCFFKDFRNSHRSSGFALSDQGGKTGLGGYRVECANSISKTRCSSVSSSRRRKIIGRRQWKGVFPDAVLPVGRKLDGSGGSRCFTYPHSLSLRSPLAQGKKNRSLSPPTAVRLSVC